MHFHRFPAMFALATMAGLSVAHADDYSTCFSLESNDYKKESFVANGTAACTKVIAQKKFKNADLGRVYATRGYWLQRSGDLQAAMSDFNRALDLAPNDVEAYDYRADLWVKMGNDERALADYEQAIRVNPQYSAAHLSRGMIYEKRADNERAKAEYRKVLALPVPNRIAEWARDNAKKRLDALEKAP